MRSAEKQSSVPKIIVPAAGFGKRVGSPLSKEMLLVGEAPLIQTPLGVAQKYAWPIHVITRAQKTDLITYLSERKVAIQVVEETKEWPETILASEPYWGDWNILFLPDVHFAPESALESLWNQHANVKLAALTFQVDQQSMWGCLRQLVGDHWQFAEKPQSLTPGVAWGFLLFHRSVGRSFFLNLLESSFDHSWKDYRGEVKTFPLESFRDLTRG